MTKSRLITICCANILLCAIVTACGPSDQSETGAPPPRDPRGKPVTIKKDEASSALALFMTTSLAYLHQSVTDLTTLGEPSSSCREVHSLNGAPRDPKNPSEHMKLVLNNKCSSTQGFEEYSAHQVRLLDREKGLKIQFDRATMTTFEPLKIKRGSAGVVLLMQNELRLQLSDATAHIYSFELTTRWATPRSESKPNDGNGSWIVRLSGRLKLAESLTEPVRTTMEVYDLISSVDSEINLTSLRTTQQGFRLNQVLGLESSGLKASSLTNNVRINHCGYPETNWASIYTTSLFQDQQLDLNFSTIDGQLSNLTTKQNYKISQCGANSWAANALNALVIHKKSRTR